MTAADDRLGREPIGGPRGSSGENDVPRGGREKVSKKRKDLERKKDSQNRKRRDGSDRIVSLEPEIGSRFAS